MTNNKGLPALFKYEMVPSLQHLAYLSTIHNTWDYRSMKNLLTIRPNMTQHRVMKQLKEKYRELNLPQKMYEKLMDISYHIVTDIVEWVKYHNDYIFNTGYELELSTLSHIDLIVWTPRGTIDYIETGKKLILLECSDQIKLKLAYAYCLEEYPKEINPKILQESFITVTFPKNDRFFLPGSSIHYWVSYKLQKSKSSSYFPSTYRSSEKFLFNYFSSSPNYTLSRHLWPKLAPDERLKSVIEMVSLHSDVKADLQIYFLSKLDKAEQEMIVKTYLPFIFKIFVTDYQIRDFYGSILAYMWEVMSIQDFLGIVRFLYCHIHTQDTYCTMGLKCHKIFSDFWNDASFEMKQKVLQKQYDEEMRKRTSKDFQNLSKTDCVLFSLTWEGNEDLIKMIMSDATTDQKKCFITVNSSISYGIHKIKQKQYDDLEQFMRRFVGSEKDFFDYKKRILRSYNYQLIVYFLRDEDRLNSEQFYQWCFKFPSQKEEFMVENRQEMWKEVKSYFFEKKNILEVEPFLKWCLFPENEYTVWLNTFKLQAWHHLLRYYKQKTIIEIEYFLNWSFKTEKRLYKSRAIIPDQSHLLAKFICTLIKANDLELINQLLNWCFLFDQNEIRQFKNDFLDICDKKDFLDVIDFIAVTRRDDFHMFISFFSSWFSNSNEFDKFKRALTQPKTSLWIIADFVRRKKYKEADCFFQFCGNMREDQIENFKKTIFLDDFMRDMLRDYKNEEHFVRNLKQWINPNNELYEKFRYKFFYQL